MADDQVAYLIIAGICAAFFLIVAFAKISRDRAELERVPPEEREAFLESRRKKEEDVAEERRSRQVDALYGPVRPAMICPHCQQKGGVRAKEVKRKKGVSGGKAAAAILTAGVSVLRGQVPAEYQEGPGRK